MVISFSPKSEKIKNLVDAAQKTKCLQELLARALEAFVLTEEGQNTEAKILAMSRLKISMTPAEEAKSDANPAQS